MEVGGSRELLPNGSVINGRYEVLSTLGFGGMGTVIKVRDLALDGEIGALKILFPHLASDQIQFGRFRNEVLLARRLSHPHIVRIYDFGSWEKYYFLSMEFVEGGTLTDRIYGRGQDRLMFDDAIRYLLQILDALSCAHKSGVVHRDMKPDNIMITVGNSAKVTDFGLARAIDIDKRFTMTGETVGTPYYMSPEQLAGEKPDERVDIYSLGIMAYEMMIGRRPFSSDNYMELAHMHMTQALPDICQVNASTPKWFREFVEACCEKRKEDRFNSSEEGARFLLSHLDEKDKKKVYRVPAVLSVGTLPSIRGRGSYRTIKRLGMVFASLWMAMLIFYMLPIGPLTYGKLRSHFGGIERAYPFLSFDRVEDFPAHLNARDWYQIKELLIMEPSLTTTFKDQIIQVFSTEDIAQIRVVLERENNKEFLLDLILASKNYDVIRFCVEKLNSSGPFAYSADKEDALVAKLMSFNEPSLLEEFFSASRGGLSWLSKKGESLLVFAYRAKAWNTFRVLLERGASPDAKLSTGQPIVTLARKEMPDVYELLQQYGADTSSASVRSNGKASYSLK